MGFINIFSRLFSNHKKTIKSVGMIASANLFGTVIGILGSLVQAKFIIPGDLGFIRKYSVISSYSAFLSLGLFIVLQREYSVLIGRGEQDKARQVASIVQTWCAIAAVGVCGSLLIVCLVQLFQGNWREASAWFIQVVTVWATLYGGYLACTFRSGQEFERLAKSSFMASIVGVFTLPLFMVSPFSALVLRSVAGSMASSAYLHFVRPLKVGLCLPLREFFGLVKRGMRLFVGDYLRYQFWLALEIWMMLKFSGETGVGLFVFSTMIVEAVSQVSFSLNQIYVPRLAHHFGQSGSLRECLLLSIKPTIVSVVSGIAISCVVWIAFPHILVFAFPHYVTAIPILNVLLLNTIIVALSLPLYTVALVDDYVTMSVSAIIGLIVFIGVSFFLKYIGMQGIAVVWGTIAGRFAYVIILYMSLFVRMKKYSRSI